ncbi:MAG: hypothetical protein CM1200mP28_12460 [Deltaproteobacteria bacterium]|nr:MAG: hypothetical protein CM1200mP28_12460 [Deltaproteobacteria bacterium]
MKQNTARSLNLSVPGEDRIAALTLLKNAGVLPENISVSKSKNMTYGR